MRWVKWNSASRFSCIVTFSKPAGAEKRSCAANKDTREPPHLHFAKALCPGDTGTVLCHLAFSSKRDVRVSTLLRFGGDTKDLLKSVSHTGFLCIICTKHVPPGVWACTMISDSVAWLTSPEAGSGWGLHGLDPGTNAPSGWYDWGCWAQTCVVTPGCPHTLQPTWQQQSRMLLQP